MTKKFTETILLSDAHAHVRRLAELEERQNTPIPSLLSAGTPEEAGQLFQLLDWKMDGSSSSSDMLLPTCGIHPWHADQYSVEEMLPYLEAAPVIGEIGMDSVWCQVPLSVQEAVFRRQLALACQWKKPVVLHTKGQEQEIASILREYPNRYLVHWYSCEKHLEEYRKLDCYFSIGPDVWWNPAVRNVASQVPLHRLLIETDGMDAVRWAWEEAPGNFAAISETSQEPGAPSKATPPDASSKAIPPDDLPKTTPPDDLPADIKIPADIASSLCLTLRTVAFLRALAPDKAGKLFCRNLLYGFLAEQFQPEFEHAIIVHPLSFIQKA